MEYGILLEDIAAIKFALEICNISDLKRDILLLPTDLNNVDERKASGTPFSQMLSLPEYLVDTLQIYSNKKTSWNDAIKQKAKEFMESRCVPEKMQEKLISIVLAIGMRMLTWAEYHEGTLGFSREYSFSFLKSTLFSSQGIIDSKKAASKLMNDNNLSIAQKYKLACLYCFTDRIPFLYKQMAKEDQKHFYNASEPDKIYQPGLVKFWSYYLMSEVDKVKEEKSIDEFRFEKAIESGSRAAVEYCLNMKKRRKEVIVNAALEAVIHTVIKDYDWIVFRKDRYDDKKELWTPRDYYVDIICCLLTKMKRDQQVEFLRKDIEGDKYRQLFPKKNRSPPIGIDGIEDEDLFIYLNQKHSIVLEHFLNWPYQNYFMKTAELMWEFLPENLYIVVLLKICEKIEAPSYISLKHGEEKSFDYRKLLKEFWFHSPARFKRYVFSNREEDYDIDTENESGEELLIKLLTLKNFTMDDTKNIQLILNCATDVEKEHLIDSIIFSYKWRSFCAKTIQNGQWQILDRFVVDCSLSNHDEVRFKRDLKYRKEVQCILLNFLGNENWKAFESFAKWSSSSEEEIHKFKKELIISEYGMRKCIALFFHKDNVESADKILQWCLSSEEQIREFKTKLIFSDLSLGTCSDMVERFKLQIVDKFTKWCLSSEENIEQFKEHLANSDENAIFEILISGSSEEDMDNSEQYFWDCIFNGGKWDEVNEFIFWCFSSVKAINVFKKNNLFKISGVKIHFKLIKANRFSEAERFFAWLNLSKEEIKELKKKTLCAGAALKMFNEFLCHEDGSIIFSNFGSKHEAIKQISRWYLTDEETIVEFEANFKRKYQNVNDLEVNKAVLKNFDLMIEERLAELNITKSGSKRKSETYFTSKKFCNLKLEDTDGYEGIKEADIFNSCSN